MAPKLDRLLNLSAYIFCSIILTCLILLTPADAIYQCYKTHRLINIFFIAGAYIITFLLAVLIYATRIYTNRRALTGIPKAWIPVEKEDVGSSVRRLVMDGLSRSAMIAYQARPRDLSDNKNNSSSSNNNNGNGNNNETTNAEKYTDPSLLIDRTRPPPWGVIEHPGWSSPASSSSSLTGEDLLPPDTPYRTVIQELPYLIEAKAVSLAPPDPVFTASTAGGYDGPIPDTRVVEVLQRAAHMGVREYIVHLSSLDVVRPAEIAAEFVALYERARFSAHELYEAEFRELMRVFAEVLRGMVLDAGVVEDIHARSFTSSTTTSTSPPSTTATTTTTSSSASGSRLSLASESVIGPSDEEGETDTVDYHSSSSRRSPWSDQRQQHPYQSLITPRTPSVRSLHRMRSTASASSAASSGGSVIRHVDYSPVHKGPKVQRSNDMTTAMQSLLKRGASFFTPSSTAATKDNDPFCSTGFLDGAICSSKDFRTAPSHEQLFRKPDPVRDGEECLHDCSSCTVRYPAKFDVDMKDKMYGNVSGWSTHLLVATGKTDWVRDVADEKGSLMEAIERGGVVPSNGNLKLTASNIPVPDEYHDHEPGEQPTSVLLLPGFTIIDHVTPALTPDLIKYFVNPSVTTTSPLVPLPPSPPAPRGEEESASDVSSEEKSQKEHDDNDEEELQRRELQYLQQLSSQEIHSLTPLRSRSCPHSAVILLCSQRTRDVRCGQSAPLLRKEFERHLRPLGLYRELDDERPGGVGIYFVSHVGGHKYAANVIVYRRRDFNWYRHDTATIGDDYDDDDEEEDDGGGAESDADADQEDKNRAKSKKTNNPAEEGASQGIWLARVRPEDCENIIRYTVLQGKVVKPGHQLRGGFDREKGLISW